MGLIDLAFDGSGSKAARINMGKQNNNNQIVISIVF